MNHAPTTDIHTLLLHHGLDLDAYADLFDADVVGPELQAEALALLSRTDIDGDQMAADLENLMDESGSPEGAPSGGRPTNRARLRRAPTRMAREPMAARLMREV